MSRTSNWDAVLASEPLNQTAGKVVAKGADHYSPKVSRLNRFHSETPLPVRTLATETNPVARAVMEKLIGQRFGRLTVMGIFDNPNPGSARRQAPWAVRCACGRYETRTRKALVNSKGSKDGEDRCSACWDLVRIKFFYARDGGRPLEDFTDRGERY